MTVHLWKHKISYFSVPKIACSSVKQFFYEIENSRPFKPINANGRRYLIHDFYRSVALEKVDLARVNKNFRFAVVRDPVERIVSCYKSKVVRTKILDKPEVADTLARRNLPLLPTFEEFVTNLDEYRDVSAGIRHHSEELRHFLGEDPTWFTRIFDISELAELEKTVCEISGYNAKLPYINTSKKQEGLVSVSDDMAEIIKAKYQSDYALFGAYMRPCDTAKLSKHSHAV